MKILVIAHYTQMPEEKGNNRFNYIADCLAKDNQVELITSTFSHKLKRQRNLQDEEIRKLRYKITNIYEPGYKKNVSLKRIYSYNILARNLKKYLKTKEEKPDVIYCAIPSLSFAKVAAKFAKKNNIRFIIDVQDLWPEAFRMVFKIPVIKEILFYPMERDANYIYKQADDIIAVSETYANRASKANKKYKNKLSVFLGTELEYFDKCRNENIFETSDKEIKIAYIGTLGHSYDIKIIIDALEILKEQCKNFKFIIMGDGPLKLEFEEYAKKKQINCEFTGRLDYPKMIGRLCDCDIAVNPIMRGSAGSIINKVGDYASAGLPVINTQENEEYKSIVEKYNIGFNCKNDDAEDVAEKLKLLIDDKNLRTKMGRNNRMLAEEKFDRKKTYLNIFNLVKKNEGEN